MTRAAGHLRYEPRVATLPTKGRWLILRCDRDWHHWYAIQAHKEFQGRWVKVIDKDRVSPGSHKGVESRLGLMKPTFQEPAWGPHISVVRGNIEKVTKHLDVWNLGARIGAAQQRIASATHLKASYSIQALEYEAALATLRPGIKQKIQRAAEASLLRMRTKIIDQKVRLERGQREEGYLLKAWEKMRRTQNLPSEVMPGGEVLFDFDLELRLARTHWYLEVRSPTLIRIRAFFGLRGHPRVPFHLTVGVTED